MVVLGGASYAVVVVEAEAADTFGHGADPIVVVGEGDDGGVAVVGAAAEGCFVIAAAEAPQTAHPAGTDS